MQCKCITTKRTTVVEALLYYDWRTIWRQVTPGSRSFLGWHLNCEDCNCRKVDNTRLKNHMMNVRNRVGRHVMIGFWFEGSAGDKSPEGRNQHLGQHRQQLGKCNSIPIIIQFTSNCDFYSFQVKNAADFKIQVAAKKCPPKQPPPSPPTSNPRAIIERVMPVWRGAEPTDCWQN